MTDTFTLVVNLWIRNQDIAAFEAFERKTAELLQRHGGKIDRAMRVADLHRNESSNTYDSPGDAPFEIHLVSFPNRAAFDAYRIDPEVVLLSAERERIILKTVTIEGYDSSSYFKYKGV